MSVLTGKRILITRPRHQAGGLAQALTQLGAQPVILPTIEIAPLEDTTHLDDVLRRLIAFDWVVFTSANGVAMVWDRLSSLGIDQSGFVSIHVAAIGPATAEALSQRGITPSLVPDEYIAEAIAEGLGEVRGQRILLLRADIARESLAQILEERGAAVENVPAYRTVTAQPDAQALAELERGVDIVTLTSASTARSFAQVSSSRNWPWLAQATVACIGPITADAAKACGLTVQVVAEEYTGEGLVRALVNYFEKKQTQEAEGTV